VGVNGEEEMSEEDDDNEEVESISLRSTQPKQSTSIFSSSKGKKHKDTHSMKKSSNKKAKKTGEKKVSSMLKKLIEELLTDTPVPAIGENLEEANESVTSIFLQLSNKIDNAKTKNEVASQGLAYSYFDFEKAVFK